jgi:hypothetical protein
MKLGAAAHYLQFSRKPTMCNCYDKDQDEHFHSFLIKALALILKITYYKLYKREKNTEKEMYTINMTKQEERLIEAACNGGQRRVDMEYKLRRKRACELNKDETYELPVWTEIEGCKVLRFKDSPFVAIPDNGRENSREFTVIDLRDMEAEEPVCFLNKNEVQNWLIRAYEGLYS